MTTIGVCMVKDEADIIGPTVAHMAYHVDSLIIADNGSTDGTRRILADMARHLPLTVLDDPEPAYYQSAKMSHLAACAAAAGAQWVVPFDADELWYTPHGDRIADLLAGMLGTPVVRARLFNHWASAKDGPHPNPFLSMRWRETQPAPLDKVAFRWEPGAVIHQGNHGVSLPGGVDSVVALEIRHFPYRTTDQFVRKALNGAAAYALTDLPEYEGAHWRQYGALHDSLGREALEDVFREHFWRFDPAARGMVEDPAPYRGSLAA